MRESLRINYFAQLLVPVIHVIITIILLRIYLSSYNKLDRKNNSTHFASHNPVTHSMRKNYKMSGKFAPLLYWSNYLRTFTSLINSFRHLLTPFAIQMWVMITFLTNLTSMLLSPKYMPFFKVVLPLPWSVNLREMTYLNSFSW